LPEEVDLIEMGCEEMEEEEEEEEAEAEEVMEDEEVPLGLR
jgi:hypothetical protein